MQHRRWYDNDSTLSMAVSLLQNAPPATQFQTSHHVMSLLAQAGMNHPGPGEDGNDLHTKLTFLFPFRRRKNLDVHSWRVVELLKHLPEDVQREMAVHIINHVYMLESRIDEGSPFVSRESG